MRQRTISWLVAVLSVAGTLSLPAGAAVRMVKGGDGQAPSPADPAVTGAGAGNFGSPASFGGVPLSGMRFGMGMGINPGGTASGDFQSALLGGTVGAPRVIAVEGKAISGSIQNGVATVSGVGRIDMGDGTPALLGVPFTVVVAPGPGGKGSLTLTLGTTHLPLVTASQGSITIM